MFGLFLLIYFLSCNANGQLFTPTKNSKEPPNSNRTARQNTFTLGSCRIVLNDICPNPDVTFYVFTSQHPDEPEAVRIGSDPHVSNLTKTSFNPTLPTKVIVHGYNSDRHIEALVAVRKEYMKKGGYNVFTVDWGPLAQGPCYPGAVWNIKHVGRCASQLIERIREFGTQDIHVIGFSLGAHVTNYIANFLKPYKVSRITGLDPAMPGFSTVSADYKLDKTDAEFVDILHTNSFVQGQVQESGHVDFYLNDGVVQPGCWAENRFFACNHHRAPIYFAESITTQKGFWGWPCPSYFEYIFGRCPPKDPQIIMGENVTPNSKGVYLVITESVEPFAVGKYTGPSIEILYRDSEIFRREILKKYKNDVMLYSQEEDVILENVPMLHENEIPIFVDDVL